MCTRTDGILTLRSLLDGGLTRRGAQRRVASLVKVGRGLYAEPDVCPPRRTAAAHGGSLACISAARHWGLWVLSPDGATPHVSMGRRGHVREHDGCRCITHWERGAAHSHRMPSVRRVLVQVLNCRGVEEFFVALESARRLGMLSSADLDRLRARVGPAAREAIALSRDDADSGLESLVRWRLRHRGLTIRTQVSIVSVGRVDLLIGDRLLVEVDGIENHDGSSHRHKDLVRDAHAAAWGYLTLRFDYALVVHDWDTVELAILGYVDRGLHRAR